MAGDLLSRMLAVFRRHARAEAVCLWAAAPGTRNLHLFASDPPDLPLGEQLPTAAGLLLEACRERTLRWVEQPTEHPDFQHPPLMMDRLRPKAAALLPVGVRGEGAAAVAVVYLSTPVEDPSPLLFEWGRWAGLLDVFLTPGPATDPATHPDSGKETHREQSGETEQQGEQKAGQRTDQQQEQQAERQPQQQQEQREERGEPQKQEEREEGKPPAESRQEGKAPAESRQERVPSPRELYEEEAASRAALPPDHALQQAAAGLARRVRERLASIEPSLQQAEEQLEDGHPASRFLRYAREGLDRSTGFLSRVLAFADDGPLMVETVSMTDCVAEALRTAPRGGQGPVKVRGILPQGLPRILADRVQVVAALSELIRNGLEAAPGGTEVVVEVAEEESGIAVSVEDEGPGMDAETVRRCVRPFFSTKRPDRHAGLGLAAVQGIVHRHGGHLFISSRPGAGTRVRLWLPLQASPPSLRGGAEN